MRGEIVKDFLWTELRKLVAEELARVAEERRCIVLASSIRDLAADLKDQSEDQ
jgi:hypothetical protein